MEDWVFVDTCIWSSFFGKPTSPEKLAVDDLLDADRVALVGPIISEVLLGFRRKDQADWVVSRLRLAESMRSAPRKCTWTGYSEVPRAPVVDPRSIPHIFLVN